MPLPPVEWPKLFIFTVSPFELFVRGTIIYLFVFVLMRIFRREPGTVGIADLLMVVLIADASQNAMSSDYHSVLDGLVLILTIVSWNFALDWLTVRFPFIERFTYPAPVRLVRDGSAIPKNMRSQFVTQNQLMTILREHGMDDLSKASAVYIEGSGHASVIPAESSGGERSSNSRAERTVV